MAIKTQALADFVAKFTHDVAPKPEGILPEVETLEKQDQEDDLVKWKPSLSKKLLQSSYIPIIQIAMLWSGLSWLRSYRVLWWNS